MSPVLLNPMGYGDLTQGKWLALANDDRSRRFQRSIDDQLRRNAYIEPRSRHGSFTALASYPSEDEEKEDDGGDDGASPASPSNSPPGSPISKPSAAK
ncbi:hypothetical protein PHYPSEUDO_001674 [Phytophthora pseudosyringae]|uniref:Uncharacterized protein n=1 Tax=Phytophthora pseudosyringae TaxID=221518 RepID=A0A8T1VVJ1_9STRA|nr:hypothetical protein PHYPSEUDO_001674 [Phytophthora pseudosyringae]